MKSIYIKDFDNFSSRRGVNLERDDPHLHFMLFNHQVLLYTVLKLSRIIISWLLSGKSYRLTK